MPYIVHLKTARQAEVMYAYLYENFDMSTVYEDKVSARKACGPDQTVSFVTNDTERQQYRARYKARIRQGGCYPPPWDYVPHNWMYPHLSLDLPGKVHFFDSEEKAVADRLTSMTPGRWLERYARDVYSAHEIRRFIEAVTADGQTFELATTADDIAKVYSGKTGFTSCMQRKSCAGYDWQTRMDRGETPHPAVAYAGPDLAVAYRGPIDAVAQRAVVWPEKKSFARVYGSGPLETMLYRAGYAKNGIDGARLTKIRHPEEGYLMPYIDGVGACRIDGDYIVLDDDGNMNCQNTSGSTEDIPAEEEMGSCAHCGNEQPYDEMYDDYCSDCYNSRWRCVDCRQYSYEPDDERQTHDSGESICQDCLDSRDEAENCDCEECRTARQTAEGTTTNDSDSPF